MAKIVRKLPALLLLSVVLAATSCSAASISLGRAFTFVGNGSFAGSADGTGTDIKFNTPAGCTVDSQGYLLVCDTTNHVVRRISREGVSTTFIGQSGTTGDVAVSPGTSARIGSPMDIKQTADGSAAYLAAYGSQKVYRVDLATGGLTNFFGVGTIGTGANQLNGPSGIGIGSDGTVFVAERLGHRVRQITSAGAASHFSGAQDGTSGYADGTAANARFNQPSGLDVHRMSGRVYVADTLNRCIRKLETDGTASTVAGNTSTGVVDGLGSVARFVEPFSVAVDKKGAYLYIADKGNNAIRRMDLVTTIVDTVFGNLAAGWTSSSRSDTAQITAPRGVCFDNGVAVTRLYAVGDHSVSYVRQAHTRTVTLELPAGTTTSAGTTAAGTTTAAPSSTAIAPAPPTTTAAGNHTGNLTTVAPGDGSVSSAPAVASVAAVAIALVALLV